MTTVRVTTDTALQAIKQHVDRVGKEHFTTIEIAKDMGADEYHVRIAFSWLTRYKAIERVPGVRSKRYLPPSTDPNCRRHGNSYSVSVYRIREEAAPVDFAALNRLFGFG